MATAYCIVKTDSMDRFVAIEGVFFHMKEVKNAFEARPGIRDKSSRHTIVEVKCTLPKPKAPAKKKSAPKKEKD